jgi:acetyl esterase/lipase
MPLYPMIDDRAAKSNKDAPLWNAKTNENGWRLYLGGLYGKDVPIYAAPARCTDYHGLPPTCTFAGDIELFYDETIAYIENLKKCGIPVHFKEFKGCYHGFDNGKSKIGGEADEYLMNTFKYAVAHYFTNGGD